MARSDRNKGHTLLKAVPPVNGDALNLSSARIPNAIEEAVLARTTEVTTGIRPVGVPDFKALVNPNEEKRQDTDGLTGYLASLSEQLKLKQAA